MSLDYAILGFLNYQPFTGYDLKKLFDSSVHHFWSADQSQIYRTLTRLMEQGLADVTVVNQEDRPDRKVYTITPNGRQALLDWLQGPFPVEQARSTALIQVFFSGQLSDEAIIAKLEGAASQIRELLATYDHVPIIIDEYTRSIGSPREAYCWMLTLEYGMINTRATLGWMESIIQRIRNKEMPAQ